MRFGNTRLELRGAIVSGLVLGALLMCIMLGAAVFSPNFQAGRWYIMLLAAISPAAILGLVVALTLIDSVHLKGDWVEHRILDRWVIARYPIVEFERVDSPSGIFAAAIRFTGGYKIRIPGAHLGVIASLEAELRKRKSALKQRHKSCAGTSDHLPT